MRSKTYQLIGRSFPTRVAIALALLNGVSATGFAPGNDQITNSITCKGFPGSYRYKRAVSMSTDETCQFETYVTEGPLAPLTDPMHYIFRGPANLQEFAVYQKSGLQTKASGRSKKPAPGSDSWADTGCDTAPETNEAGSSWTRVAKYNASDKIAQGITFLANNKFTASPALGFVPGYVASDARSQAESPETLNGYIPDNFEVIIASDRPCSQSDPCGSTAPGSIAHHGWDGDKVVIARFTFPDSRCVGASSICFSGITGAGTNWNKPAWWALGDTVVHNLQYGASGCNSWKEGAGELDIHEVLEVGGDKGYLSFHMGKHYAGTSPFAFPRPFNDTMTLAVISSGQTFHVQVIQEPIKLADSFDAEAIVSWFDSSSLCSKDCLPNTVFDVSSYPGI